MVGLSFSSLNLAKMTFKITIGGNWADFGISLNTIQINAQFYRIGRFRHAPPAFNMPPHYQVIIESNNISILDKFQIAF